jgi:transcription elongation factor GreA
MITAEGLLKLREDLTVLKTTDMREALKALADARDKGDITENGEYETAREGINMLGLKIGIIEKKISECVVVHKGDIKTDSVQLFTTIKLLNKKTNVNMVISIVTDDQIDVINGKISQNSPIAQGLIGKSKGSVAKISVPAGVLELEITEITV